MRPQKLETGNVRLGDLRRMALAALTDRLGAISHVSGTLLDEAYAEARRQVMQGIVDDLRRAQLRGPVRDLESLGAAYQALLDLEPRWDGARLALRRRIRRAGGAYYTPRYVVDFIVRHTLGPLVEKAKSETEPRPLRVLDPAAGAGHFLLRALEFLTQALSLEPSVVAKHCLFGIEQDPTAAWLTRVALAAATQDWALESALEDHIVAGDALLDPLPETWGKTPTFSAVIGNPPYQKERDARQLFQAIRRHPRWELRAEGKMDLWQFFAHLALDVLDDDGRHSFIVPSYWLRSQGAQGLRQRLLDEAQLELLVFLRGWRVFPRVGGDHLIYILQKGRGEAETEIREPTIGQPGRAGIVRMLEGHPGPWRAYRIPVAQAVVTRRFGPRPGPAPPVDAVPLGQVARVSQGVVENPDRVREVTIRKMARERRVGLPSLLRDMGIRIGQGVFVLSEAEKNALNLPPSEQGALIRYLQSSDIRRWHAHITNVKWLIYASPETAFSPQTYPVLCRHLERFRPIMERRRETAAGRRAWYHLHWPRRRALFASPKVLIPQLAREPRCCVVEGDAAVGISVNLIAAPDAEAAHALCAILNSAWAAKWFGAHAKRRGVGLDIGVACLRAFPLSAAAAKWLDMPARVRQRDVAMSRLADLARQLAAAAPQPCEALEDEINALVREMYGAG